MEITVKRKSSYRIIVKDLCLIVFDISIIIIIMGSHILYSTLSRFIFTNPVLIGVLLGLLVTVSCITLLIFNQNLHSLFCIFIALSLVHMHNIHSGANIHPGCKFAPGCILVM